MSIVIAILKNKYVFKNYMEPYSRKKVPTHFWMLENWILVEVIISIFLKTYTRALCLPSLSIDI